MGSHVLAPEKVRSERTTRGILALFLVMGVLAAITITGSGIASAGSLTGYYAPRIAFGGVDVNNDGVVDGTDDVTGFFGDTNLVDGHLDCDLWDSTNKINDLDDAGGGTIGSTDDCVLLGYLGGVGSGSVTTETYIHVVNGYFLYTSTTFAGVKTPIVNGFKMPSVYDTDSTSFNFSSTTYTGIDWVWRLKGGEVDYDFDGDVADDSDDDVEDYVPQGYTGLMTDIDLGLVDANDSGTITSDDDCTNCFFGQNVSNGYVQDNTPANPFAEATTGATGPAGADGDDGVSGRTSVSSTSSTNSLNKSKSVLCSSTTKVLGGGYSISGDTATLAHLTVVANGPVSGGWRVRVIESTPTSGTWAVTVNAICAIA